MKVVVMGAAGAQGSAIARAFAAEGCMVTGLTRTAKPNRPDLTAIDSDDADALARAFDGADALAFTSPIDHRPGVREALAERVASAAGRAGVARIVVNLAGATYPGLDRPVAAALRRVREAFASGPMPCATLEPTVYMENLLQPWAFNAIAGGVLPYPAPESAPISWISHRTLGAFAVAAAAHAAPGGRNFSIGGPEALTGGEVAARLSAVLGRPLRYEEMPLPAFAAGLNAAMGAPVGDDIADYYGHLRDRPDALRHDAAAAELGVELEALADWAARQDWSNANAAP